MVAASKRTEANMSHPFKPARGDNRLTPTPVQPAMVTALVTIAEATLKIRKGRPHIYGDCQRAVFEANNSLRLGALREDVTCAVYELARKYNLLG
jgi:hypothetical protein